MHAACVGDDATCCCSSTLLIDAAHCCCSGWPLAVGSNAGQTCIKVIRSEISIQLWTCGHCSRGQVRGGRGGGGGGGGREKGGGMYCLEGVRNLCDRGNDVAHPQGGVPEHKECAEHAGQHEKLLTGQPTAADSNNDSPKGAAKL